MPQPHVRLCRDLCLIADDAPFFVFDAANLDARVSGKVAELQSQFKVFQFPAAPNKPGVSRLPGTADRPVLYMPGLRIPIPSSQILAVEYRLKSFHLRTFLRILSTMNIALVCVCIVTFHAIFL